MNHQHTCMGYSMRTPDWRYTEWIEFNCDAMHPMRACATDAEARPHWNATLCGVELCVPSSSSVHVFGLASLRVCVRARAHACVCACVLVSVLCVRFVCVLCCCVCVRACVRGFAPCLFFAVGPPPSPARSSRLLLCARLVDSLWWLLRALGQ